MTARTTEPARAAAPRATASLHELLQRVEGEYREMPGLSVTARQAERLWALDSITCAYVLAMLVQRGTLRRTARGTYIRG